jgi:predicted transcriptional regulator
MARVTAMTPCTNTNHKPLEDVLCSKTTLKILKLLLASQLTPSEIAKSVGMNYVDTVRHLKTLEAKGLVQHINFGKRIRYNRFNDTSSRAIAVRNLIESFSALSLN